MEVKNNVDYNTQKGLNGSINVETDLNLVRKMVSRGQLEGQSNLQVGMQMSYSSSEVQFPPILTLTQQKENNQYNHVVMHPDLFQFTQ